MERMKISEIKTRSPFEGLFAIREEVVEAIGKDMEKNGYDESLPIVIWKEGQVVVDGHMRLRAARKANLEEIPVVKRSFKDEEEALEYAVHNQRDRRNLADAQILRVVEWPDERKKRGRPEKFTSREVNLGRSSQITAQKIGTSATKVEKVRTILGHADAKTKEAVKSGKMSIQEGYRKTQEKRHPENKPAPITIAREIKSVKEILDCKEHCATCLRTHGIGHFLRVARSMGCKIVATKGTKQKKGKNSAQGVKSGLSQGKGR
jgi:ParB-like chromosome segregation protein Spo0J